MPHFYVSSRPAAANLMPLYVELEAVVHGRSRRSNGVARETCLRDDDTVLQLSILCSKLLGRCDRGDLRRCYRYRGAVKEVTQSLRGRDVPVVQ